MLALTTPLAKTETVRPTQLHQVALLFALQVKKSALVLTPTNYVATTTLILVWNGPLLTPVHQVKLAQETAFAPILAQTNAQATKRCVSLTPLTKPVL